MHDTLKNVKCFKNKNIKGAEFEQKKKGNLLFLSSLAYSVNLINNTSILNKSEKIRPCGLLILSAEQTTF